jgi:predicted nucleic acid-binding protein
VLYLDTSAFLKLYIREEESGDVQRLVAGQSAPLPVWDGLEMEFTNALWLKVFRQELEEAEATRLLKLFADRRMRGLYFTPELPRARLLERFRDLAKLTPQTGCRTMDILHVAAALEIGIGTFVSFDERQSHLAALAGLPCHLPGAGG